MVKTWLHDVWKGHLLIFEKSAGQDYDSATGWRLLVAFVVVGIVIFIGLRSAVFVPLLSQHSWGRLTFVCLLIVTFVLVMNAYVRLDYPAIGLRRWRHWTDRERVYTLQVVPLAGFVFVAVFGSQLQHLVDVYGLARFLVFSASTGLLWGMFQEFVYRGLLQTELVHRCGAVAGVIAANVVFTFGPLHFNYFNFGSEVPIQWGMLAAIFGIGLFFGTLYQRSGNLWIPAILHGIWPPNMV